MFLILYPYKFTQFYQKLYGIELLRSKLNEKIEVHDLSEVLNKNWNKAFLSKRQKGVKIFTSLFSWIRYFNILKKKENLTVFCMLDIHSLKSLLIHVILLIAKVKIIKIYTPGLLTYDGYKNWKINKKKFFKVFSQPKILIIYIKRQIITFILRNLSFKKNYILYSGYKKINPIKNNNDTYIKFHSFEYSKFLIQKKKFKKKSNMILYLDSAGPYYQNDDNLFGFDLNINLKVWFSEINNFFKNIEKRSNAKVFIIPHPKNKGFENPYYDKSLKFLHEIDAALNYVRSAKLIIANSATTALTYAIASNKKIILFYNDQILKKDFRRYRELNLISMSLNIPLINISKKFDLKDNLKSINKKAFENYKKKYLTSEEISKKRNYEILREIAGN